MTGRNAKKEPTLEQRRARHAWEAVTSLRNDQGAYDDKAKKYAREAKKLPMRIMASGLGQALAFIRSKEDKDDESKLGKLHKDLTDWVLKKRPLKAAKPESLMESILLGDSEFLRRATDETLAYLQWLNRFSEAEGLTGGD